MNNPHPENNCQCHRYEQFFQRGKDCTVATYSLNADGTIRVFNKAYDKAINEWSIDVGRAVVSFPDENPLRGKLNVTFGADTVPDTSNYWILHTDYTGYAVVVSCSNLPLNRSAESYWLLSRTKVVSPEGRITANAVIDTQLDRSLVRTTIQENCPEPPPDPTSSYRTMDRV